MRGKCSICGQNMIKILGSNESCVNEDCENYIPDSFDSNLIKFYSYEDDYLEDFQINDVESDYEEEYDSFLFYSDRKDYISRYEFRKMNNFIEDTLFEDNKIAKFESYIDDDEIEDKSKLREKYEIMDEGRSLEHNPQDALEFYRSKFDDKLFKNDYYLYRKLLIFERDYYKQLDLIRAFFNSGIYCNRYNYLWFLKKLKIVSDKIDVSDEVIDECLNNFKNKSFTVTKFKSRPLLLADKIKKHMGELKINTEKEYCLNQFKYELQVEASQLNYNNHPDYDLSIYKKLILNYGFRASKFYRHICSILHKSNQYSEELKWIYGYFNRITRFGTDDSWFYNRLDELNIETNNFDNTGLFFDTNKYYLSKEDFKNGINVNFEMWDYLCLLKEKYLLINKGLELESENIYRAIDYYKSLLNHEFFENDYYIYKTLVILYDQIHNLDEEIETIFSFFRSGIYCDRYNYLFFIYHLKKLSQKLVISDSEIDAHLKYFKEHGFKNKDLENTPIALSERLVFHLNNLNIIPGEDFAIEQELNALNFEAELFQANSMFESANRIYFFMINEYDLDEIDLIKKICINYQNLNDSERELRIINEFLERNINRLFRIDTDWFYKRKSELKDSKGNPIKEPNFELLYENNEHYLSYDDYNFGEVNTELVDKIRLKYSLKRKGIYLENNDFEEAIDFYKSLLDNELFENDYYVYRRLVLIYERINDFELVYDTIKSFFKSGIYCSRYQYLWFLHKIANISQVKYISNEEIDDCLKSFWQNGFKNKADVNSPVFLAETLYKSRSSIRIYSSESYFKRQKKYELKEEVRQYELNEVEEESIRIFRNLIDNGCYSSPRDYMRLCHMYRRINDYENELYIINKYLSTNRKSSRVWFEDRLKEVNNLIE